MPTAWLCLAHTTDALLVSVNSIVLRRLGDTIPEILVQILAAWGRSEVGGNMLSNLGKCYSYSVEFFYCSELQL